ncbi:Transient receptor potential cation channel subfamily M member 1 [Echinococcus granulosus]|nr:Transient receptor potential cation channel subfamily M member 1 [Echinococcus granulosus]
MILTFITHFIEFVRIAFIKWISLPVFLSDSYHKLIVVTCVAYILGTLFQLLFVFVLPKTYILEQFSQGCLAISLFFPFIKTLRLLSIGEYVGPKLQMIKKMTKGDLLPFSLILCIFWILYSLFFSAIVIRPNTIYNPSDALSSLFYTLQSSFFQMFGEFQAEDFINHYGDRECANITTPGCTYPGYRVLIPLLMAIFTLTTHVLLINLLIAIFTKTYDRMVAISQQLWTMQRYRLVEYILVGSVQPGPFLIFSFVYQLAALFCRSKTSNKSNKKRPFRKSFEDNPGRERQLINWEKLSALVMMGMHDEGQELERASKGGVTLENRRKATESWKTPNDRSWQIVRRIVPPTMVLQSLAKPGPVTDALAKKIDDIDSKLEKISTIMSGRPVEPKLLLPSNVKPSLGLSREGSHRSSLNSIDTSDVPIVAQWRNHQIAIYSSLTSDTTPHTLDPPIPWEMPYPKYRAIPWSPRRFMVPQWQSDSMPPPEASRLHSFDSTNLSFCDSAPRNPEGRVGTAGKGLLPKYGANSACIIVVARGSISDEVLVLKGIRPQAQFPWFLCTHPPSCNQTTCFNGLVRTFCQKCQNSETEPTKKAVIDDFIASFVQCIEVGSTSDPINCDNAWLSVTAIHFQIPPNYKWISDLENILAVKDSTPSWVRTDNLPALRRSHLAALMAIKQ